MNLLERIVKAEPQRRTRLHDNRGQRIDTASVVVIPVAIAETAANVIFHYRRVAPWISYRATWDLSRLIRADWRILEFGSGMSTIWFASKARFVMSIESDPVWYERVRALLEKRGLSNVQLEFRPTGDCSGYPAVDLTSRSFDLALIDGQCRDRCVGPSLAAVRPGGYIYLDNTDQPGDRQIAEAQLLAQPLASRRYYNDFAPGLVAITQGLLVRLADHAV